MKGTHSNAAPSVGPRRTSPFTDETEFGHDWAARGAKGRRRALWLVPLVIVSIGLVAAAAMRYMDNSPEAPPRFAGQVIKGITFESGSLTDMVTGADIVKKGVTLEHEMAMKGLYSAHLDGGNSYLEERLPGTSDLYMSFYIRLLALPADGDLRLAVLYAGKSTIGNLLLRDGRLRLRVDKEPVGADSDPLVPGQLYRIGVHQRAGSGANGVLEAFVASGDAPFAAPFAATTTGQWVEGAERVRVGMTTSTGVSALLDDLRLHADDMPAASE